MNYPDQLQSAPVPGRVGQGTAVEQSRAVAEVQAAVLIARQFPRNEAQAIARMRVACSQPELAQRAFFRFPRGGSQVSGETIQFAKALAGCWGNLQHGLTELRRDDEYKQSEMQAWAWDLESNQRASTTFIVPHARWANNRAQELADFRDIYENNANNGARRLREMIFTVLPVWFIEQAKTICANTLSGANSDKPRAQRAADAIKAFDEIGITVDQIEAKLGRKSDKWTDPDLGQLQVVYQSIQRGEATRDEEFPPQPVTPDELTGSAS
ncbi:hypothetical protein ACFXD5_19510 [Streptomyces sp. NPDC059385]|uniref:hypothetical protein n=1 Tax=Streptomyces sp. NPDC059385 TaxID=3346817 RepID=UPI0036829AD4